MTSRAFINVGLGLCVLQKLEMDADYEGNVETTEGDAKYKGMSRPWKKITRRSQQISWGRS